MRKIIKSTPNFLKKKKINFDKYYFILSTNELVQNIAERVIVCSKLGPILSPVI